jgi:fluoride exporter
VIVVGFALAAAAGGIVRLQLSALGWRGTLVVNVVGSFVLGFLQGRAADPELLTVVGTGFCGALTTFGTFALEASTGAAWRRRRILAANVVGCVALASLGYWLA